MNTPGFIVNKAAGLCLLLALSILPACRQTTDPVGGVSTPVKGNKPQVALVMKSLANEFFKTMADGAEKHHQQHAAEYDLISNGIENEQDVNKQVDLVEQMIGRHVNVIVIAPANSKALAPVCKKAQDAGIVVINIDNKLDAATLKDQKAIIPFVGPDNREGARLAGDYLAKQLLSGEEVAIIDGLPGAFNAEQRHLGFQDAMVGAGAKIVASQAADWDTGKANSVAAALLPQHPQLKAILCANDNMALGVVAALSGANMKQVKVVGFDNIAAVQQMIKAGQILCTIDQHGDQIAVNGIQYGLDILAGHTPPKDKQTPVDLINAEILKATTPR